MKVKLWGISSLVHSVDQISAGRACFKMLHKKKNSNYKVMEDWTNSGGEDSAARL